MKIIYLLLNSVKTTVCNIKSNKQVFLVSIATIAIALSILGLFLVVFVNLNSFLSTWSKQVQLVIYLDDGINKAKMKKLEILISGDDNIHSMILSVAKMPGIISSNPFLGTIRYSPN